MYGYHSDICRNDQASQMEHKWTFHGHQLGVVSAVINPTGTGRSLGLMRDHMIPHYM